MYKIDKNKVIDAKEIYKVESNKLKQLIIIVNMFIKKQNGELYK